MVERETGGLLCPFIFEQAVVINKGDPLSARVSNSADAGVIYTLLRLGNRCQS